MQDKLIIIEKVKKTINYIDNSIYNFPHRYNVLSNNINKTLYDILELSYRANVYKDIKCMKDIIIKIRILEYYIKISTDKKLISFKKFDNIGNYLIEINKMINAWIIHEKKKQSI